MFELLAYIRLMIFSFMFSGLRSQAFNLILSMHHSNTCFPYNTHSERLKRPFSIYTFYPEIIARAHVEQYSIYLLILCWYLYIFYL